METNTINKKVPWLGLGAMLSAIGASACCVAPLLFLSLGIGGAWMSTLTSMDAVRPYFMLLTIFFIGAGFIKLYLNKDNCQEGAACVSNQVIQRQRHIFWIGSIAILLLLAFPWYAPYFM